VGVQKQLSSPFPFPGHKRCVFILCLNFAFRFRHQIPVFLFSSLNPLTVLFDIGPKILDSGTPPTINLCIFNFNNFVFSRKIHNFLFFLGTNRFHFLVKREKQGATVPESMETQYEKLEREDSITDSSSEDVSNLKRFHEVIICCVFIYFFWGFLQN